jgi:uncharacterized OsmC-like protein/fermentation-respiration switch protein FrsA (DUF1100 family)
MLSQPVAFDNVHGRWLTARLDLPVDRQPIAYALFVHCFACSGDRDAADNISLSLTQQGIAVLCFDFTRLEAAEADPDAGSVDSDVDDLVAAALFLAQRYEAPAVAIGHSLAGAAVLHAAHRMPSVKAVATLGAPGDPEAVERLLAHGGDGRPRAPEVSIAGKTFRISASLLDDLQEPTLRNVVSTLRRALLILHAPLDEIVSVGHAAQLFQMARHPKSFVSLDRADHFLTDSADSRYAGAVIAAWAEKYIGAPQREIKEGPPEDNRIVVQTGTKHYRTEVLANGHSLVADEPIELGGTNLGPTPYNLLVAGLGACTSITVRMYADRKGWPLENVTVRLTHEKVHARDSEHPTARQARIDRIEREIELEGPLDEKQRARLLEIADRCPVHRTLHGEIQVETRLVE